MFAKVNSSLLISSDIALMRVVPHYAKFELEVLIQ